MPKSRYAIMRRYMQRTGSMGLDMMLRTCTVQVNLDYEDEADMRRKLRVSLALQPLATALFANSPFKEGKPNGLQSNRAHVWSDVDADRTGMPAMMFAEDFGFERFTDWLLNMPMYFIQRDGRYVDLAGCSFRDFMAGRLDAASGHTATVGDFADHVTTAFHRCAFETIFGNAGRRCRQPGDDVLPCPRCGWACSMIRTPLRRLRL